MRQRSFSPYFKERESRGELKDEPQAKLNLAWPAEPVGSRSKRRNSGGSAGVKQSGGRIDDRRRLAENAVAIARWWRVNTQGVTTAFRGC